MPFIAYQQILCERLYYLIDTLHPSLKDDVECALGQSGKLLCPYSTTSTSSPPTGMWALLPFLIINSLHPASDITNSCNVAVAVECLICALDLLDDIEDGDQTTAVRQLGTARTLNVSTALLLLAHHALLILKENSVPAERVIALIKVFQERTLAAAIGQHEDIVSEKQSIKQFTEEDCIRIARGKAGSLMRLACTIGCIFVGANERTTSLFAELGELLGIAHQLSNDSHDLYTILHSREQVKTDLERHKKTLPIVLASQLNSFPAQSTNAPENAQQTLLLSSLDESIITTWGVSLLYRERAYDCLRKIEALHPLSEELHLLLGFA